MDAMGGVWAREAKVWGKVKNLLYHFLSLQHFLCTKPCFKQKENTNKMFDLLSPFTVPK